MALRLRHGIDKVARIAALRAAARALTLRHPAWNGRASQFPHAAARRALGERSESRGPVGRPCPDCKPLPANRPLPRPTRVWVIALTCPGTPHPAPLPKSTPNGTPRL